MASVKQGREHTPVIQHNRIVEFPLPAAFGHFYAAARSSLSAPRATILNVSSANGRCSAFASSHGARIQTSRSSSVARMTGMAFAWIGATTSFASVVRKP